MNLKEQIENIMNTKGLSVEELSKEVGISASVLRGALKGTGNISKYGKEKLEKYCADNGITEKQTEIADVSDDTEIEASDEATDGEYIQDLGNALKKYISDNLDLEADADFEEDCVTVGAPINFLELDRGAYISLLCSGNTSLLIYIIFGEIQATLNAYELINNFNASQPIYKAIINEEGRFELQFSVLETSNVEQTLDTVDFVLTRLFEEPYESLLKPIAELIKK